MSSSFTIRLRARDEVDQNRRRFPPASWRYSLDADQLQGALEASGVVLSRAELLAALGRMRGYLVEDRAGALSIFHAKLAEHVAGHALSERDRRRVHGWLAAWLEADDGGTERAAGSSRHGLAHRAWHLREAGRAADAAALLGDFTYLSTRVAAGGPAAVTPIEEDWREMAKAVESTALAEWSDFLRASGHVVRRGDAAWPAERIFLQRAWEHGTETAVTRAADAYVQARGGVGWPMLRRWHRVADPARSACLRVLEGHSGHVTCVALHADGRRVVSAGNDRTLRVWNLDTGACVRVLEGHRTL